MNSHQQHRRRYINNKGFTLVEIVIVAPIIILLIGAFVTAIVSVTGDVMSSRDSNVVAYNIKDTLNKIRQDVYQSDGFLAKNSIDIVSPQGYDNDVQEFRNANADPLIGPILILNMRATDKNPLNNDRSFLYAAGQPYDCTNPSHKNNSPLNYNVVYFVKDETLWRRVLVPQNFASLGCGTPWQKASCDPSISDPYCTSKDSKLVNNIKSGNFTLNYFSNPSSTIPDTRSNDDSFSSSNRQVSLDSNNTVEVMIKSDSVSGGNTVSQSESARATTYNNNSNSIIITLHPSNQTVNSGSNATFTASSSRSSAIIQWQRSTNLGTSWSDVSGATSNTLTVSSTTNVMDGYIYRVRYTNGTKIVYSNSARLTVDHNSWTALTFTNTSGRVWKNYDNTNLYNNAEYRKTSSGIVFLRGLIEQESTTPQQGDIIATLPEAYRPPYTLVFSVTTDPGVSARLDIEADGDIVFRSGSASWLSLEGVHFIPKTGRYNPQPINIYSNGWRGYGGSVYGYPTYYIDEIGRIHTQGIVNSGNGTDNYLIYNLKDDVSVLPSHYMHMPAIAHLTETTYAFASFGISTSSKGVVVKPTTGSSSGYLTLNSTYHPSNTTGWYNLSRQGTWAEYGGSFTLAQCIKSSDNVVTLRGLIKDGSTTDGSIIANLPSQCSLGSNIKRMIFAQSSVNNHARVDIDRLDTNNYGRIIFKTGSSTWLSLDGISFYFD